MIGLVKSSMIDATEKCDADYSKRLVRETFINTLSVFSNWSYIGNETRVKELFVAATVEVAATKRVVQRINESLVRNGAA